MTSKYIAFCEQSQPAFFHDPERFANVGLPLDPDDWFTGLQTHNKPRPTLNYTIIDDSALKIIFRLIGLGLNWCYLLSKQICNV